MSKINFNVKSGKSFRDTLAKWDNAIMGLADECLQKSERVSALRKMVKTNDKLLERIANGDKSVLRTLEDIQNESAEFLAKIDAENVALAELRKAQAERLADAEKLVSKDMHKCYCNFMETMCEDTRLAYNESLRTFFMDNGFTVSEDDETIPMLMDSIGKKVNSARNKCKSGKHNGAFGFNQWRTIFLGAICDELGTLIPKHKFVYVLKENRNK